MGVHENGNECCRSHGNMELLPWERQPVSLVVLAYTPWHVGVYAKPGIYPYTHPGSEVDSDISSTCNFKDNIQIRAGGVCQAVVVGNWLKKDCQSSNVNPETPSFKLNRTLGVIKVFAAPSSSAFPPPAVEWCGSLKTRTHDSYVRPRTSGSWVSVLNTAVFIQCYAPLYRGTAQCCDALFL